MLDEEQIALEKWHEIRKRHAEEMERLQAKHSEELNKLISNQNSEIDNLRKAIREFYFRKGE